MQKFKKLVLYNDERKITVKPIRGAFKVTEETVAYYHRGGILPQTEETVFEDEKDVERYLNAKEEEGYTYLATL